MRFFRQRRALDRRRESARTRRRLCVETLEDRRLFAGLPYGATVSDTAEYMLGKVVVTPVFVESREGSAADLYDWSPAHIQQTKQSIITGMQWWVDTLATLTDKHSLEFVYDWSYADTPVNTNYEPIARKSIDYSLWVPDFLQTVGAATTGDLGADVRAFNNSQRVAFNADWSFTIFVANAENDTDGNFASCSQNESGCFPRAFAFAGGLFFVTPSTRPASTFTHETGHIFWAFDEYPGGASYSDRRGYYNTQNTNAANNPAPGFTHQPSIMSTGSDPASPLMLAYNNHVSPASTLAIVGWQDSDGDGIFDVLDVPHTLTGSGYLDATTGKYRFIGESSVQTLANRNPSGLQNDITINKISRAQYRIDGGSWQTAATYGTYQADLNLLIAVPAGNHQIEIRTIDDTTGVTSPVFVGTTTKTTSTTQRGINGFVWNDANANGIWDANETGMPGWTVRLVDNGGQPITLGGGIDPDSYGDQLASGGTLNNVLPGVTLTAIGSVASPNVKSGTASQASTGNKVFYVLPTSSSTWSTSWNATRQLRIGFSTPASRVQIDAVGERTSNFGRLEAYDAAGNLLQRYTTAQLARGETETMTIERPQGDIAYVLAFGHNTTSISLDNFRYGGDTSTTSELNGVYRLQLLPAGSYRVQLVNPGGWTVTSSAGATQTVAVSTGATVTDVNFGLRQSTANWQNTNNPFDVNNDNAVSPIDALLIINVLNDRGSHKLLGSPTPAPPYIDVNGDGYVSPIDALQVINELNRRNGQGGEGPSSSAALVVGGELEPDGELDWTDELIAGSLLINVSPIVGNLPLNSQVQVHSIAPVHNPVERMRNTSIGDETDHICDASELRNVVSTPATTVASRILTLKRADGPANLSELLREDPDWFETIANDINDLVRQLPPTSSA